MVLIRLPLLLVAAATLTAGTVMGAEEEPFGLRGTSSVLEDADLQGDVNQYECTMAGATGQDACDAATAGDGSQCVWCSVSTFGFCVSEDQADTMKKQIPGLTCDDDGNDDDAVNPDDDDDNVTPDDDDAVPDDYWSCMKDHSTSADCAAAGCVWCNTKHGYGVCMNHDSAEYADKSDWFSCDATSDFEEHSYHIDVESARAKDPFDTTCIISALDGGEQSCLATVDANGIPCEWCVLSSYEVCLAQDQADNFKIIGADCNNGPASVDVVMGQTSHDAHAEETEDKDPFDTACMIATLQGEGACKSATDSDGQPCEWCVMQGGSSVCVDADQAAIAEQGGFDCGSGNNHVEDPLDTACMIATLQGEDVCKATTDSDGQPCEWCTMQGGQANACLNGEQAAIAEQGGFDCDEAIKSHVDVQDPWDTSCLVASLQGDEATCEATVDADGQACQWCSLQGGQGNLCLSEEQAAIAEQVGVECGDEVVDALEDPFDTSCLTASLQGDEATCKATVDQDGQACVWCELSGGQGDLCLNAEQSAIAEQVGAECDSTATKPSSSEITHGVVAKGSNLEQCPLLECLKNLDSDGCGSSSCTWCTTQCGHGVCLDSDTVDTLGDCPFFDCTGGGIPATGSHVVQDEKVEEDASLEEQRVADPYDPKCLNAVISGDEHPEVSCSDMDDSTGQPCVWCDAAGVFGLCLSSEQATKAGRWLDCASYVPIDIVNLSTSTVTDA